jgi:two-component system, chemotaxis family, CheB/CheR fusion protein
MKPKPPPRKKPPRKKKVPRQRQAQTPEKAEGPASHARPVAIVGIGASAGGLEAFTEFLKAIPADTGLAFVYIQHLAPNRVSMLSEILGRATSMPVSEIKDHCPIERNHVYVVPPGRTAAVRGGRLRLSTTDTHRAVDQFLSTLAEARGPQSVGVVLSGTATDGTFGLKAIKAAGGVSFAQNSSAQHDGMPRSAVSSGCVDFVLAPAQIAQRIVSLLPHLGTDEEELEEASPPPDEFAQVLAVLRQETGVDFTHYKANTLHRRIRRRMALHRLPGLTDYAQYLSSTPKEANALYQDILIGVTSFFRDAEAFDMLKERVFPPLFQDRSRHDPVRLWVLGCATGEEAYSLAIAVKEFATSINSQVPLIVYATDLNDLAIEKSRAGLYPRTIAADVSPERLRRFFVESDGGYRISKSIRDMCVFARQNVLTDPPFSRMDLISCRNVLIYMETALQRKLLPLLHYALKSAGFLFLGPSESLGGQRESFEVVDARHKVFRKKPVATRIEMVIPPLVPPTRSATAQERGTEVRGEPRVDIPRDAERVLLSRYVPAGVLINQDFELLQVRGDTGLFLAPGTGKATLNVLKMARDGLLVPLRTAVQRALKENTTVRQEGVRVKSNGGFKEISLTAIPVHGAQSAPCCWIMFELTPKSSSGSAKPGATTRAAARRAQPHELRERNDEISHLTHELAATREYLQSVIEQQEAANEELQSANEEVQSANEELQSINEELETSKEEIQSSNEELTTVNEELHNRNEELNRLNNDLNNLFSSVQMAMVMVWRDLRIRRFTPLAEKLFNLIASDVGRPISDIKLKIDVGDLPRILSEVIDSVVLRELEVQDPEGHWYQLRLRPYKTFDNKIDGAVIMLVDIDTLKKNQEAIARQAELLEHSTDAVFVHDPAGVIQYWNRGAELLYGIPRVDAVGKRVHHVLPLETAPAQAARKVLDEAGQWRGELMHRRGEQTIVVAANQVLFEERGKSLVLETHHDVSEHKRLEATLQKRVKELALADQSKNDFLAMLAHELRNPLAPLRNAVQILKRAPLDAAVSERTRDLIDRQVTNMVRMVDDLLDAARLTKGRVELKLETLVLQPLIQRALDATRASAEERGHHVAVTMPSAPVRLRGDATRLEQVFTNLLNNAVKYTEKNGEIGLTAVESAAESEPSRHEVIIRVRDNGIGIAPEMLPRVFDLFTQADHSIARTQGGLGIGLNIVRSLVEMHGGEVWAHSAGLRLGSEFVVRLPVLASEDERSGEAKEKRPREEALQSNREPRSASRFLVVDDSADIAESTATLLGLQGYDVRTATSGEEALQTAEDFQPDFVLLDLGMPGLDGFAVARRMRARQTLQRTTLIAVSGYGSDADRRRAQEAGFDFHFTKPLDLNALEALVLKH